MLLHRPYCGNPFVAPGTIGSKTRRMGSQQDVELGMADEAAFFNENEETMLPQGHSQDASQKMTHSAMPGRPAELATQGSNPTAQEPGKESLATAEAGES